MEASLRAQVRDPDTALELFAASSPSGRALSEAILSSTRLLVLDDVFMRATDRWFRWTPRDVRRERDGPSLDCAGLAPATRILAELGPRQDEESFHRSWVDATRDIHLATAPVFGILSVRDSTSKEHLIEAGRLWQRLHLEATLHGVAMQPLDQWLEHADRARQLGAPVPSLGMGLASGFAPVMMFRAGTALRPARPSARRLLDDVLLA